MAEQERTSDQDKESQQRSDVIAEFEVATGFRIKDVPASVRQALVAEGVEAPERIRLSRVNPFRRSEIAKAVQRRFHRDLKDPDILSNAQVLKLVEERGEWSGTLTREMEELQEATTREMGRLWADGLTPETTSFADGIVAAHGLFHKKCETIADETKRAAVLARFDRWVSWSPRLKDDPRFAPGYDAGLEIQVLFDEAPGVEAVDIISDIEELKEKQERLLKLTEQRLRLAELQLKHARIFSDTAEARRDQTEQMAQLYWTCQRADAEGKPAGLLTKDFDALWNWPDSAIQWLLYEAFFFHNGIPDEARDYLGSFGFFTVERENTGSDKPDESLAQPNSKIDGEPVMEMPVSSSAPPGVTT